MGEEKNDRRFSRKTVIITAVSVVAVLGLVTLVTFFFGRDGHLFSKDRKGVSIETNKDVYGPYRPITVSFRNMPGYSRDWISIAKAGQPANFYETWTYTGAKRNGSVTLRGLMAGNYEVRAHVNGGFAIYAVCPFRVR